MRLNTIYRKVLEYIRTDLAHSQSAQDVDQIKFDREAIEKLKATEKAWVQYRDLHCDAARHQNEGGSMDPMIWGFCMADTTDDRIAELKRAYEYADRKLE